MFSYDKKYPINLVKILKNSDKIYVWEAEKKSKSVMIYFFVVWLIDLVLQLSK